MTVNRSDFQLEEIPDESPDTSFIGEYANHWKEGAIDRKERGDMSRNEYRYFIPAMSGEATGNPDSPEQDYERMESLNRGAWCFIGIRASVEVNIPLHGSYAVRQTFHSPGLWGIESDSGKEYLREVFEEESNTLAQMLESLGVQVL